MELKLIFMELKLTVVSYITGWIYDIIRPALDQNYFRKQNF